MAAFEPWQAHVVPRRRPRSEMPDTATSSSYPPPSPIQDDHPYDSPIFGGGPATTTTYAAFSPTAFSGAAPASAARRRNTILVHHKSPLLLATPPQVTRALAYSHPFLLPLNKVVGLLTWTTSDLWQSFLMVVAYWVVVLYSNVAIRYAGPLVLVALLSIIMYGRRYSPLSSSWWSRENGLLSAASAERQASRMSGVSTPSRGAGSLQQGTPKLGHSRDASAASVNDNTSGKHQKTLDEMIETLKEFTSRCNMLIEPLLELTDFLSTQRTPTSASTRPALGTLFLRIMLCLPIWVALTLPPLRIITTSRVMLVFGTIILTWHAPVMKAARTILWRSRTVRRLFQLITGLRVRIPFTLSTSRPPRSEKDQAAATDLAQVATKVEPRDGELSRAIKRARGSHTSGVRFTFTVFENQRRWVGLGWTNNLFAYERTAWTDEHQNAASPRDEFELPKISDGSRMKWHWAANSRWRVDGVPDEAVNRSDGDKTAAWDYDGDAGKNGWVYYDNKWQNGRRGSDGWGRWTRRRKWYRDAELIESDESDEDEDPSTNEKLKEVTTKPVNTLASPPKLVTPSGVTTQVSPADGHHDSDHASIQSDADTASISTSPSRPARFRIPSLRRRVTESSTATPSHAGNEGHSDGLSHASSPLAIKLPRRTSEVVSDDDEAAGSLGASLGVEMQRHHARDQWGVGDEVRMSLE